MGIEREAWDCVILGGGPAGLAAGVYMGRYLRQTLIVNHPKPLTRWHRPTARNLLGFPAGIMRSQLLEWGRDHVHKYESVCFRSATVHRMRRCADGFCVTDSEGGEYRSRGLIIATGVEHELPEIPGILDYAGYSIWHCPDCDGHACLGKPIAVIGHDRGSAEMALCVSIWSPRVMLCMNGHASALDAESVAKLHAARIRIHPARIRSILGDAEKGSLKGFALEGGETIEAFGAFVNPRPTIEGKLLAELGLELQEGWIKVDHRMRTNIPCCYAAGDIVANVQTQLAVAMGTGATAAIWLHKELLPPELCLSGREW